MADANGKMKNAIRDRLGEWNGPDDLPPKERPEMQADEYPFATTEEGLSRARAEDGILDGSVAWVHGNQNRVAGTQLQQFYRTDRVLFGGRDEFWSNRSPDGLNPAWHEAGPLPASGGPRRIAGGHCLWLRAAGPARCESASVRAGG